MYLKANHKALLLPLIISLLGMTILFLVTGHGLGLSPDSVSYIHGGRALVEQGSLSGLSSHWPPGYPALLALFSLFHNDFLVAARLAGMCVFAVNLFLCYLILQRSGWSNLCSGLFAALMIVDLDFLNTHLMAWSEPAFLALILAGLLALLAYGESGSKRAFFAAAAAFGMSALVRYAGIAFIIGAALIVLYLNMRRYKDRQLSARLLLILQFMSIALTPISLWILGVSLAPKQGNIRSLAFHAIPLEKWQQAATTIAHWFGSAGAGLVLVGAIAIILTIGGRHMSANAKHFLIYAGIFIFTYVSFVLVSILLFDAYTPLDFRILFPVKLLVYLMMAVSMQAIAKNWKFWAVGAFALFAFLVNYSEVRELLLNSSVNGIGFAQIELKNQPMISFIKRNHIEVDATNSPELFSLYLNQEIPLLPASYDPTTKLPRSDQADELRKLEKPRNTVVIFDALLWRDYLPRSQQLMDAGFANVVYRGPDGTILQHP